MFLGSRASTSFSKMSWSSTKELSKRCRLRTSCRFLRWMGKDEAAKTGRRFSTAVLVRKKIRSSSGSRSSTGRRDARSSSSRVCSSSGSSGRLNSGILAWSRKTIPSACNEAIRTGSPMGVFEAVINDKRLKFPLLSIAGQSGDKCDLIHKKGFG